MVDITLIGTESSRYERKRVAGTVSTFRRIVARVGPTIKAEGTTVSTEAPKRTSRKGIPNHPVEFGRRLATLACEARPIRSALSDGTRG